MRRASYGTRSRHKPCHGLLYSQTLVRRDTFLMNELEYGERARPPALTMAFPSCGWSEK